MQFTMYCLKIDKCLQSGEKSGSLYLNNILDNILIIQEILKDPFFIQ